MTKQEATELITKVCRDYRRSVPKKIQLYQSTTQRDSSGRYSPRKSRLHVTLGTDGGDHAETVIHETVHHIYARAGKGEGHTKRFWNTHYSICDSQAVTPDHKRNVAYKAKAAWVRPMPPVPSGLAELLRF